jgi:hypothetical protein
LRRIASLAPAGLDSAERGLKTRALRKQTYLATGRVYPAGALFVVAKQRPRGTSPQVALTQRMGVAHCIVFTSLRYGHERTLQGWNLDRFY